MNRKAILKKGVIVTAICSLMTSLTACGNGGASTDPNAGMYNATVVEMSGVKMDADEVYEDGIAIELRDKGKAKFIYEGEDYNMKWSLDGEDFSASGGGADLEGTLSNGTLVLEDLLGSGMSITLVNSDYAGTGSVLDKLSKYASGDYTVERDVVYETEDDWDIDWDSEDEYDDEYDDEEEASGSITPDADHQDAGYYEVWYISYDGQEMYKDDIEQSEENISLTLNPDGTGYFSYVSYPDDELEWTDGRIELLYEDIVYTYEKEGDDKLWITDDYGNTYIFKKEAEIEGSGSSTDDASSAGLSEGAKIRGLSADLFGSGDATVDQIAQAYKWLGEQDDKYNDPEIFDKLCKQIGEKPKDENDGWDNTEKAYFQWNATDGNGLLFANFEIDGDQLLLSGYNISGTDVSDRYNEIK